MRKPQYLISPETIRAEWSNPNQMTSLFSSKFKSGFSMAKPSAVLAMAVFTTLLSPISSGAEVVGAMTALQTSVSGTNGKKLAVGSRISLGDSLKSNKTGLGMIVFHDESSAKIGPNSNLTIDNFVYNPGRSKGSIGIKMKSGLVRFYGGQVSKVGKMEVTTPHIVLGVRGGILDTLVDKSLTTAILRAGRMFCNVNGQKRTITKPGFACISNGTSLRIELFVNQRFSLLDSLDRIAGTGTRGQSGNGINVRAACIGPRSIASPRCKSENGSLPGVNGKPSSPFNPAIPLGSEEPPYRRTYTPTYTTNR